MIKLTGINKIYRTNEIETVALENVNLEVNKGEFLSIMGPSGCGKSTLLNIMGLLDAPTSGTIEIAGTKVDGMKDKELAAFRNQKLGFVFQSFHLINSLNVLDNVELPLLGMTLIYLTPPMQMMANMDMSMSPQEVLAQSFILPAVILSLLGIPFLLLTLVWLFNALKVSCNLKGWHLWAVVLVGILGGDVLCRMLISHLYG